MKRSIINRSISLFVVAFLCLNAGGFLCLAYCSDGLPTGAVAVTSHCHPESAPTHEVEYLTGVHSADCCSMPVSFFAAPFEKKPAVSSEKGYGALTNKFPQSVADTFSFRASAVQDEFYRPPFIDSRFNRLKMCVIRI